MPVAPLSAMRNSSLRVRDGIAASWPRFIGQ
jgi:hypothetical protein